MLISPISYVTLVLRFVPLESARPEEGGLHDKTQGESLFGNNKWASHSAQTFVQCFSGLIDLYDGEEQARVWQNVTGGATAGEASVARVAQWIRAFATQCAVTIYNHGHEKFTIWLRTIDFDSDYLNVIASTSSTGTNASHIDGLKFRKLLVHTGFHALVLDAYQTLDSDKDKHVSLTEFAQESQTLIESGCTLSAIRQVATQGADAVFESADWDQDHYIDKNEFNAYAVDSEVSNKSTIGTEIFEATGIGMEPFGNTAWASHSAQQFVQCFSDLVSDHSEHERTQAWQQVKSDSSNGAVSVDSVSRWIESRVTQCSIKGVKDGHEFRVWLKSIDFDFQYLQTLVLNSRTNQGNSNIDESKFRTILVHTGFHALVSDAYQTLDSDSDRHVSLSEFVRKAQALIESGCTLSAINQVATQGADAVFESADRDQDHYVDKNEFNAYALESEVSKKSAMGTELSETTGHDPDPPGHIAWASLPAQQFLQCFSDLVSDSSQEQRAQAWQEITKESVARTASVYSVARWMQSHVTQCVVTEVRDGREMKLWLRSVDFDFAYLRSFASKSNVSVHSLVIEESLLQSVLVHTGLHVLVLDAYQALDSNHDKHISLQEFTVNSAILIRSQCSLSAIQGVARQGPEKVFVEIDTNSDNLLQKDEFHSYAVKEGFGESTLAGAAPGNSQELRRAPRSSWDAPSGA